MKRLVRLEHVENGEPRRLRQLVSRRRHDAQRTIAFQQLGRHADLPAGQSGLDLLRRRDGYAWRRSAPPGLLPSALMENETGHGSGRVAREQELRVDGAIEELRFRFRKDRQLRLCGGLREQTSVLECHVDREHRPQLVFADVLFEHAVCEVDFDALLRRRASERHVRVDQVEDDVGHRGGVVGQNDGADMCVGIEPHERSESLRRAAVRDDPAAAELHDLPIQADVRVGVDGVLRLAREAQRAAERRVRRPRVGRDEPEHVLSVRAQRAHAR